MLDYENIIPAMDRILLISWLLKDFGWMSTNIYLGWPFGFASIFFHLVMLFLDPRTPFRFYNFSLLCWVTGNWFWMSIEFIGTSSSSSVHWGPHVPLSTMSDTTEKQFNDIKLVLFFISLTAQVVMYTGIWLGKIDMPRHFDEDNISLNELNILLGSSSIQSTTSDETIRGELAASAQHLQKFSTAFVEYMYIVCWIMKDLFWSCGTGDIETSNIFMAILLEAIGLLFGFFALCVYCVSAYINRRCLVGFLDCLTTLFWISANYVWMCGEFFLRYRNSKLDDGDEGNDTGTRIASTIFFVSGICIQIFVIGYLTATILRKRRVMRRTNIEMFTFTNRAVGMSRTAGGSSVGSAYSPQSTQDNEGDDEMLVLF